MFTQFRWMIRNVLEDWEIVNVLVVSTVFLMLSTFLPFFREHTFLCFTFICSRLSAEGGRKEKKDPTTRGWLVCWPACFNNLCLLSYNLSVELFSGSKSRLSKLMKSRFPHTEVVHHESRDGKLVATAVAGQRWTSKKKNIMFWNWEMFKQRSQLGSACSLCSLRHYWNCLFLELYKLSSFCLNCLHACVGMGDV